jgi:hypothetical protein
METDELTDAHRPRNFKPGTGSDRYARFAETWLDIKRTDVFNRIAEALETQKQTIVIGGNGLGKSYAAAILGIAALYTNPNTVVPVTAGNGDTLKNSIWKPIKSNWRDSGLPGDYKDNDRSLHTGLDDEWFLECHSPQYPEDLEGDHNANVVYIIEEAEKPGVTKEHIDSARSTLGDNDHILVLANPPTDEANIVHDLVTSESWSVLRFPTWESRNAKVDRGVSDNPKIGGLSGVQKLKDDWREYHDDPWPGIERVIEVSSPYLDADGTPTVREWEGVEENPEFRPDLHERWYKRRAGIMPPEGSDTWRPFTVADVKAAYNRAADGGAIQSFGVDVARSGDQTVGAAKANDEIQIKYARQGANHVQQKEELRDVLFECESPEVAVDAVGEGSGLADELNESFATVKRFSNGMKPQQEREYYDAWAEALALFGEFLDSGGSFTDEHLYEEALAAARSVEFDTRTLTSRGGDVVEATAKDAIKERIGHSPDYLDAALMANWMDMAQTTTVTRRTARTTMQKRTQ